MKGLKIAAITFMFVLPIVLTIIAFECGSGLLLLLAIASFCIGVLLAVIVAVRLANNEGIGTAAALAIIFAMSRIHRKKK